MPAIEECIRRAARGDNFSAPEMEQAVNGIVAGAATPAQVAALLVALSVKGETPEEIAGAARAMRAHAVQVRTARRPLVDVCGTGGDGLNTFNISTAVAFVVAGAGVAVAKHGNRAVTGRCGSADVLRALGVRLEAPPEIAEAALATVGVAFLFAPNYHPAMGIVGAVRREIGVTTLFNLLGPLTNPAGATRQVIGVANAVSLRLLADALTRLGSERAALVRGDDGLDEVTLSGPTKVLEWTGTGMREYAIVPEDVGLERRSVTAISGGDARENAQLVSAVLEGRPGPHRDVVLINAALALKIAGAADGLHAGMRLAEQSIVSGTALAKLEALVEISNR
ncbi:MAG: anthranilate phosphoribosyltransferase [Candidatus Eremiobacteraeota bacterium]|nr:anthranilate phosphoribosyltransferase [Candidatus Eremiobacteraeota bacterium]MBC5826670.1 anthranilate phosphoribosyltransferase [Candidatus Eremiobacteraeota bacterium]